MDKQTEIMVQTTSHKFYCDDCGEFLGESVECPDGYYEEVGHHKWKYSVNNNLFVKEGEYCNSCAENVSKKVTEALENLGFKKDNSF